MADDQAPGGGEEQQAFVDLLGRNTDRPMRVGKVDVQGFVHTDPDLFRPAIERLLEAETFGSVMEQLNALAHYMQRLDIFQHVDATVDTAKDGSGELEVTLQVEERGRLGLKTETQLGQQEADAVISGVLRNFLGRAECLSGTYSVGTRAATSYQLRFTRPLYDESKSFDLSAFKTTNNLQPSSSVHEIQTGMAANFRQHTWLGTHHVAYTCAWRELLNATDTASWAMRSNTGHTVKSSVLYSLTHDRRNSAALPSRGHVLTCSGEYAGLGGDVAFAKAQADARLYLSLPAGLVLGATVQAGMLYPLNGTKSPFSDRFFLGGPLSVRGFYMRGAGPRDKDDALGGDVHLAGGLSLRRAVPGLGPWLQLQGFANAGNLAAYQHGLSPVDNIRQLLSAPPRTSAGVGLLLSLGVARLEVNYCWPLSAQPTDARRQGLQIGLGMDFL
eukprot:comp24033_c0_seq1/m.43021 comp24033_c0_seq1/g.43021  ORF comp24033_c0_seq1/g.43021 comp24033_c0_seq1/m.43021 type:complete len:444 (-) comp24033_c0_seq1:504-1835(-)